MEADVACPFSHGLTVIRQAERESAQTVAQLSICRAGYNVPLPRGAIAGSRNASRWCKVSGAAKLYRLLAAAIFSEAE